MNVHEYQAKALLGARGVKVPRGIVVADGDEAARAARELGSEVAVVKAQIHAGGRGAGAVVETPAEEEQPRLKEAFRERTGLDLAWEEIKV